MPRSTSPSHPTSSPHKSHKKHRSSHEHRHAKHSSSRTHKSKKPKAGKGDSDSESMWVEKTSVQVETVASAPSGFSNTGSPAPDADERARPDDCLISDRPEKSQAAKEDDYFGSLGTELRGRAVREAAEVERLKEKEQQRLSSSIKRLGADDPAFRSDGGPAPAPSKPLPGGPGYQWRLTKLKRTYEAAAEENRAVEDVAKERYGSLEAWEDANEERRLVEGRHSARGPESGRSTPRHGHERRYMFTSEDGYGSRPASRAGFRKPVSAFNTPDGGSSTSKRVDQLRQQPGSSNPVSPSSTRPSTPIPSVLNPLAARSSQPSQPPSTTLLNKLQANLLKAQMMDPDAVPELERQYKEALQAQQSALCNQVEIVPSLDGRGRMYDIGTGAAPEAGPSKPGNRRPREAKFETRDPKTGELVRYNADDDQLTLSEMVRQEKFQAGAADQKNMDVEMAGRIMGDSKFENDLDYMDDNADRLARKKMKTDASKRLFAINDYARTQKALSTCQFCFKDDGSPPANLAIISTGTKVYLCCPEYEELVEGHCWIVPIQHSLCSLEADDDVWDEIKNYMKCLMRMFAEEHDQGVLFYETVLTFKHQRHSYIEAVPIPWDLFHDAPAYFRESINTCESEWSQHKKLIDFSARPGGFRRSMVSKLPYFMVQWDYKGEKGYGHVIEGNDESAGRAGRGENGEEEVGSIVDEEGKDGKFPRYFAAEIIGNLLELEPNRWRRPKRTPARNNEGRVKKFMEKVGYSKYDWTGLL